MIKNILLTLVAVLSFLTASAQELTVKSFTPTTDAIARTRNVMGTDGNVCAAVVVRIPSAEATFDGGFILGRTPYKNGEYILDMQTGAAQMRVSVPGYNTIDVKFRDYIGSTLQSKTTYLLTINMPQAVGVQKKQTLNIKVTPSDAIVQIDGDIVEESSKMLTVGTHKYNVAAKGYYPQEGTIEISENAPAKLLVELDRKESASHDGQAPQDKESVARSDSAKAIYKEGEALYEKKKYAEALQLFRQASDMGSADAQSYLGYCYEQGLGVEKDYAQALEWYEKAVENGSVAALNNIGVFYANGIGVTQDYAKAVYYYKKAADRGSSRGMYAMGFSYDTGRGVAKDDEQAAYWYEKAAERGNTTAQYYIALKYYYGSGVKKDKQLAKQWLEKAAAKGYENAKKKLKELSF